VTLVDTSVWIDHLRKDDAGLRGLLDQGLVLSHPLVIGELAMGSLKRREVILKALQNLPKATVGREGEVLEFISTRGLSGLGIGYIDAHLLTSVQLTTGASLWTRDRRLFEVANKLGLAAAKR
jgi:predicted nucleic acid-binding protein